MAAATLRAMMAPIAHRGPDDSGVWTEGAVGLGHLRLSIVDLSPNGHQPMVTEGEAGVLSYNGEVYNFRELRRDLEREGVVFRGNSDTEVVLASLEHWGPERAIPMFNGMFAFAYFDRRNQAMWLARDRLGIKPLYIAESAKGIHFASEVKGLRALPELNARINRDAVLRQFIGIHAHDTMYDGIEGLPPGHWWKITADRIDKHAYFDLESALDIDRLIAAGRERDPAAAIEALRAGLKRSVAMHLASDAPLAAMCSGGVDSSLIAAYAHDDLPGLKGYVADLPPGRGEGAQAMRAGAHIGVEMRRVAVERDEYMRLWALANWHLDRPSSRQSDPSLLAVTKACRKEGIKVLLTGEGADELFGGYDLHKSSLRRWRRREMLGKLGFRKLADMQRWSLFPTLSQSRHGAFDTTLRAAIAFDANAAFAGGRAFAQLDGAGSRAERAFLAHGIADMTSHLAQLLYRHDHMGMAASIEMRVPFIENGLIDMALHTPQRLKFRRGQGKWIEKRVAEERLPRDIIYATKKGFPTPQEFATGTEALLRQGRLAALLGWTSATTESLVEQMAQMPGLRFLAVSAEMWLQMTEENRTPDAIGEDLSAAAGV